MSTKIKALRSTPGLLAAFTLFVTALQEEREEMNSISEEEQKKAEEKAKNLTDKPYMDALNIEITWLKDKFFENTLLVEAANAKDYDEVAKYLGGGKQLEKAVPGLSFEVTDVALRVIHTFANTLDQDDMLSATHLRLMLQAFNSSSASTSLVAHVVSKAVSAFIEEAGLDGDKIAQAILKARGDMPETVLNSLEAIINLMSRANNKKPD